MTDVRDDLEVQALFREPPERFIAARDALVRSRKAADDPSAAAIKALRKPTVPAWALDQLGGPQSEAVDALLDAGAELRSAQQAAVSSTKHARRLRDATTARRAAVATLVDAAAGALREAGRSPDPHLEDVSASLEAASVNEEAAHLLRTGTFERPMRDPGGFGDVFGLQAVPDLPDEPHAPTERARGARDTRRTVRDRHPSRSPDRAALRADADRLRRDRQAAERRAGKTRETADRLAAEAGAMQARLDVVEAKGRDAERAARAAERDARAAIEAHDVAVAALKVAD
ncbi:MAG: hypothetical protein ACXWE5_11520 [Actinomycetota bacterium]